MRTLLGLAAIAFSAGALAQAPSFEEVDENADGVISEDEARAIEGLDFQTADANQDGELDRMEYEDATGGGAAGAGEPGGAPGGAEGGAPPVE